MMVRYFFLCYFIAGSFYAFSQTTGIQYINSLYSCEKFILRAHRPEPDKLRHCIDVLESSNTYCISKPWLLLIGKGREHLARSNFQRAADLFEEVLPFLSHMGDTDRYHFYLYYGSALSYSGETDQSITLSKNGVREALDKGDSVKLSELYSNLATSFALMSQMDSSIFYYKQAMKIATLLHDELAKAIVNINFGTLYCEMDLITKAKTFYSEALEIAIDNKYPSIQEAALRNIGFVLYLEEDYDSSIAILKKLQKLLLSPEAGGIRDMASYSSALMLLGSNYCALGETEKAEKYMLDARDHFVAMGNHISMTIIYNNLVGFYLQKGDYDKSIAYGDTLLRLIEQNKLQIKLGLLYQNMAKAYEAKGDLKMANFFHNKRSEYDAKAYDQKKIISLESAVLASGMIEKERELMTAKSKLTFIEKNRWALITGLFCTLSLLALISYAYRRSSHFSKRLLTTNTEKEKYIREQENKLKAQTQKLMQLQAQKDIPLSLPNGKYIQTEDILYIKSEGHYLLLKTLSDKKYVFRGSLAKFIQQLPMTFIRIHYSYIVNLSHISSSRYREAVLSNGEVIKIGPTYVNKFKEAFLSTAN